MKLDKLYLNNSLKNIYFINNFHLLLNASYTYLYIYI